jgi:hypothetical protein
MSYDEILLIISKDEVEVDSSHPKRRESVCYYVSSIGVSSLSKILWLWLAHVYSLIFQSRQCNLKYTNCYYHPCTLPIYYSFTYIIHIY